MFYGSNYVVNTQHNVIINKEHAKAMCLAVSSKLALPCNLAQPCKDFHAHAGEPNFLSCAGKVAFAGIVPL